MTAVTTFTARGGIIGRPTTTPARPVCAAPQETTRDDRHQLLARPAPGRPLGLRLLGGALRVLTTLALLVLVATFTTIAVMPAVGARAMIVLSGSMEPVLSAGDAAIIRDVPPEDLRVGDVITYYGIGEDKGLTTHRIIDLVPLDGGLHFQTQGDANRTPDPNLAPASNVVGRYDGVIPHGGRLLLLMSRPVAKIVLVALPALVLLIGELRTLSKLVTSRLRDRSGPDRRRVAFAGLTLLLVAAVAVTATAATMAVFSDSVAVSDNTVATATTF
ncbi:MAG: signal peptidase I [Actinobacteria bacterium]|nr:signal peptidase I [Actinomycetota bacterium]